MTKSNSMLAKEFIKDLRQYFSSSYMWLREKLKSPNLNVFVSQRLLEIEGEDNAGLCEADRTLFDLPDPGDKKIPSTEHRQALVELFEFLGKPR